MAKIGLTKLGLKKQNHVQALEWNGEYIEVKQYLPINDKLELISKVINKAADENNFSNPLKQKIFMKLEIVKAYTDINFTEKQEEDPCKLYDLFEENGLFGKIFECIPSTEIYIIEAGIKESAAAIYQYRNSVLGLLESISQDYSNLNFDISKMKEDMSDPNNMTLLKDVLTKLG